MSEACRAMNSSLTSSVHGCPTPAGRRRRTANPLLLPTRSSPGSSGRRTNGGSCVAMSGWVDNTADVTVPVPIPIVWELWQDKSRIPNWMPWISSVESMEDDTSRWTLSTDQFGQHFEFSWVARDLAPIKQQKIHWTSEEGLKNRGSVRFFEEESGAATRVQIQISYEVPDALVPFGSAVSPVVEQVLKADLQRFSVFARKVRGVME